MTPTEFALWLNGALGVMDDQPTPEQMAKIREQLGETIGQITAKRLLERAEEQLRKEEEEHRQYAMKQDALKAMMEVHKREMVEAAMKTKFPPPPFFASGAVNSLPPDTDLPQTSPRKGPTT